MKKLLSLLSVLTISGTAVPTTIAASPYPKEEILNNKMNYSETNNLENLQRSKRENVNITLNVPSVIQEEEFRCGPAIGESILRYFNFTRPNPLWEYQNTLSLEMNTGEERIYSNDTILGTIPQCWQCTMNSIIRQFNLNENRNYSLYELRNNYNNHSEFFNIVLNSLRNNTPVALAYSGNMPGQDEETLDQHFVLIYGINGNSDNPQNINYYYMDPGTGRSGVFDGSDLYDITKGRNFPNNQPMKSYILFYNTQNNLNKNILINLNNNEYCDIDSPVNISKITVINFLNENNKGQYLKSGDIFVGTIEGLYLVRKSGIVLKVDNIDNDENDHTAITSIKDFGNGNFFVSTNNEEVYFLNTKPVNNGHIIAERLWNAESSNLEKELRIYYNSEKSDVSFQTNYKLSDTDNKYGKIQPSINLGKISPIENYKKIDFLGNNLNTYMSWGNDGYKGTSIKDYVKNENLDDLIINKKIINNNEAIVNSNKSLQSQCDKDFIAGMCVNQNFGLTFYWENNYFLQIIAKQYIRLWSSYSGGTMLIDIGNGIRLYNDDYDDDKDNYAYFSLDKKNNLQLLIKYPQILYSEFIRYHNYYLSKFSKYFEYSTIKKFYSFLENFLTK